MAAASPRARPLADAPSALPTESADLCLQKMNRAGLAAVLSFFIPGVGQIYNGDFLRGIFWLIITPGMWIGTGGTLGWVCHLIAAYTAHGRAKKLEFA